MYRRHRDRFKSVASAVGRQDLRQGLFALWNVTTPPHHCRIKHFPF